MGRLKESKIIEISTSTEITYSYDDDGLLLSMIDPRGTLNYEYDALHRLTRKKHGTTVLASYSYDGTATNNAIGRLITEKDGDFSSGADKTEYTYDTMGRLKTSKRTISGTAYTTTPTYDLLGNIATISYPATSGIRRKIAYEFNAHGEVTKAKDVTGTTYYYVYNATYANLGPLDQINFVGSTTLRTNVDWNKRGLLTSIFTRKVSSPTETHLDLDYTYYNNGQIQEITDNITNLRTEKYTYEDLGRILTAQRGPDSSIQRKYTYEFDRYGNRWKQILNAGSGYNPSHTYNSASNRVTTSGFNSYDSSGNQTTNGAGISYSFDQENFMTGAGASNSYTDDAQGRRVKKIVSGTTTHYFHLGSTVISELQGSSWTDYIFFAGQRIAKQTGSSSSTATYLVADHLGSVRATTNSSGSSTGTCHYDPYGEVQSGSSCTIQSNYRFAGIEWDSETDLYHTLFRQYDCKQARWMGVDPIPGNGESPQSQNRYGYVENDPVNYFDPLGLCGQTPISRNPESKPGDLRPGKSHGSGAFGTSRDGGKYRHQGADYGAPRGHYIFPILSGVVTDVGRSSGKGGNFVEVTTGNVVIKYFHLANNSPIASKGDEVLPASIIGFVGTSGSPKNYSKSEIHVHAQITVDGTQNFRDPVDFIISPCPNGVEAEAAKSTGKGGTKTYDPFPGQYYTVQGFADAWFLGGYWQTNSSTPGYMAPFIGSGTTWIEVRFSFPRSEGN